MSETASTRARILDGAALAREIGTQVAAVVAAMAAARMRAPGLAAVLVGEDPASRVYVGSKTRAAEQAGFASQTVRLPVAAEQGDLLAVIDRLNADPAVDGILVQLPLPPGLAGREIFERIDPDKDVDGLHPLNVGRLWLGEAGFVPATPAGILELLKRSGIPLLGRRAVIVGRSHLVGKPLAALLLAEHCTVTLAHSRTRDLAALCRTAEILVAAVGRPAYFTAEHIAPGAVVVDVGIHRLADPAAVARLFPDDPHRLAQLTAKGSTLVGDVDPRAYPRSSAYTPVPGGVGPLTVASLLVNTLAAARRRQGLGAP